MHLSKEQLKKIALKVSLFLLLMAAVLGIGRVWYWAKDGFAVARIQNGPLEERAFIASELPSINALKAPYHYLGRGRQCYAFLSEDRQYVLKIPRVDRYRVPLYAKFFSKKDASFIGEEKKGRQQFTWRSLRIAAEELSEETGLLYLHLHETQHLPTEFTILDKMGRPHRINLNTTVFALQKWRPLMIPLLDRALQSGDRETSQRMIGAFCDFLASRASKEIFNKDPSFRKNFGWDGEKSVQIDIGSFYHRSDIPCDKVYDTALLESAARFREWLRDRDASLLAWFDEQLAQKQAAH